MIIESLEHFLSSPNLDFHELDITDRRLLPNCAAVYLLLADDNTILYVGQSEHLVLRWLNHDKLSLQHTYHNLRIAWLECSDPSLLKTIEAILIERFDPPYNLDKPRHCSSTPDSENAYGQSLLLNISDSSPLGYLLTDKELTGDCWRVLLVLMHHLEDGNLISVSQAEIAAILNKSPANISKLFKVLEHKQIIQRGAKRGTSYTFRLNPKLAWRGDHSSLKVHLNRLK